MTLTPEQFNQLATKDDLKEMVSKEEMGEFKNDMFDSFDKVMKKLDDIMDYINAAAQRFVLFDIHTFRHELRDLAAVLYEATELLCETVPLLRSMKNDEQIRKNCAAIAIIENKGDGIRRRGLMRLFKEEKDAIQIIKWKEILEKFERTIDTCEHTANVISGIVVEAS